MCTLSLLTDNPSRVRYTSLSFRVIRVLTATVGSLLGITSNGNQRSEDSGGDRGLSASPSGPYVGDIPIHIVTKMGTVQLNRMKNRW